MVRNLINTLVQMEVLDYTFNTQSANLIKMIAVNMSIDTE